MNKCQQALEKLKIYIPMERGLFSQHNKEVNELIEIISKGLNADQHSQPTIEEVEKEWEELGYEIQCYSKSIHLVKEDRLGFEKTIVILRDSKSYKSVYESNIYDEDYTCQYSEITLQEHNLLTKTFRALGWEV